jgi:valyl-tRNA synthetase
VQDNLIDKKAQQDMDFLINLITCIRNIRSDMLIPLDKKLRIVISVSSDIKEKLINTNQSYIRNLAKVEVLEVAKKLAKPRHSATAVVEGTEIYLPLEGFIDIDAEKSRLSKQVAELEGILKGISVRLNNKDFLKKAPEEVVEKEKEKASQLQEKIDKLKESFSSLRG